MEKTESKETGTKKLDFRVQRTYRSLTNALKDALQEKNFEDITVGELCDRAMIRRATFYKHFADKYDLFSFSIRELMNQFTQENALTYNPQNPGEYYVAMIDRALRFMEQHLDAFTSVMKSSSSQVLLDIISDEIEKDTLLHLRADEENGVVLPARPEPLAAMMTVSLVYVMRWWSRQDCKMPRRDLVNIYTSVVKIL